MENREDLVKLVEGWEFDFDEIDDQTVAVLQDEIENLIPHCIDSKQPGAVFEMKFRDGCNALAQRHGVRLEGEKNQFIFRPPPLVN